MWGREEIVRAIGGVPRDKGNAVSVNEIESQLLLMRRTAGVESQMAMFLKVSHIPRDEIN